MDDLEHKHLLLRKAAESLGSFTKGPYSLSRREEEALFLIVQHSLFDAFSEVSLRDIAANLDVGLQTARKYTLRLEEKHLLKTTSHYPLKFALTDEALEAFNIAEG